MGAGADGGRIGGWWGKYDAKTPRKKDPSQWLSLEVDPIVEPELFGLARRLRDKRDPPSSAGRVAPKETLLKGLVQCTHR